MRVVFCSNRADRVIRIVLRIDRVRVTMDRSIGACVDRFPETGRPIDTVSKRSSWGEVLVPESVSAVEGRRIKQGAA